ncbi:MAG: methyltransferase domain-containing protein [Spirochaetes bacterium]|nr:methyltransferase domain-containing protein [Spirochaetota bacterium]
MSATKRTYIAMLKKINPSPELLAALEKFDRAYFLDPIFSESYYVDEAIPIGSGERTEKPSTLVRMISYANITKNSRVLEIGTGSGYSAALLSELAQEVVSIEIREELAIRAKTRHERLKIRNTRFFVGDGTEIDNAIGTFDTIFVWGACFARPLLLTMLLKKSGKIIFPMGPAHQQQIAVYFESDDGPKTTFHEFCFFSPLVGKYGTEIMNRDTVMARFSLDDDKTD